MGAGASALSPEQIDAVKGRVDGLEPEVFEKLIAQTKQGMEGMKDKVLSRSQFEDAFGPLLGGGPIVEATFKAFDEDKSNSLDAKEILLALATLTKAPIEEKIALIFHSYDLDGNGVLTRREIARLSGKLVGMAARLGITLRKAWEFGDKLDKDLDGTVELNEFIALSKADPVFLHLLGLDHID